MRVLHVLDHSVPLHSGYSFRTLELLRGQREMGWETLHLTSSKQGVTQGITELVDGWEFHRTLAIEHPLLAGTPLLNQYLVVARLRNRIEELARAFKPDVIHAHSPVLNAWAALEVGDRLGIPVVYEIRAFWEDAAVDHGSTVEGSLRYGLTRWLETRAIRRAHHVFTICEGLRTDIVGRGIDPRHVTVIPNAVDATTFDVITQPNLELKKRLGLSGKVVVGFVGSFYGYEGLDLLVDALPKVREKMPDAALLLVGGGPQEAALRDRIMELQIDQHVIFAGRVPHCEVTSYYSLIDVLAYPRHSMRLTELVTPLKPLEAMAQGRLFVASDVGGHRELIEDGKTGVLFGAESVSELATALVELLGASPEKHARLRTNGREFVERIRTWRNSVINYRDVYSALIADQKNRADQTS